jgi:hypothetical protein
VRVSFVCQLAVMLGVGVLFFERLAIGRYIFCTMQTGREAGPVDIH